MNKNRIVIYCITINNKEYVGSTINYKRRITKHKSDLKCNRHDNSFLQNAWNKYLKLEVRVLEEFDNISQKNLVKRENYWKVKLKAKFNIQDPVTNFHIKPVYKFDLFGNFLEKYASCDEASNKNSISYSNIIHCAQINEKSTKSAGGFLWSYNRRPLKYINNRFVKVYVYDISGKYLKKYDSMKELCSSLFPGIRFMDTLVNRICNNKSASVDGYRFSYKKVNQLDNKLLLTIDKNYPIVQMSLNGKKIKIWNNIKTASKELGFLRSSIIVSILSKGKLHGFYWKRLGS